MLGNELTVLPAFGRDYKSMKAAKADWDANKDFFIATPGNYSYINKQDADQYNVRVMLRYDQKRKVMQLR